MCAFWTGVLETGVWNRHMKYWLEWSQTGMMSRYGWMDARKHILGTVIWDGSETGYS